MFNIIDHCSGYNSDFVVLKDIPFRQEEFRRRVQMDFFGKIIFVVSPEDLLLSKLIWTQDIQSPIQMEDIKNLIEIENLDIGYISNWVNRLSLKTFNIFTAG